jgi:leader peptidase (prepilin peptidase) / N-methyltransferase
MLDYILVFILGLCVGSFLNVLVYREAEDEGFLLGRSYCDACKKKLSWYENIPLLSYIFLRGCCKGCGRKISLQYPLVELLTGVQFVWIYFLLRGNLAFFSRFEGFYSFLSLFLYFGIGACLLAIFVADIKYFIIPDSAIFLAVILSFFKLWADYRYTGMIDFSTLPSAVLTALFFLFLVLATKGRGMGVGDIKLGFLMGLLLGFPEILAALFTAFLTGALVGVILILTGKKGLKSKIAFGPFLILGTVISLIYGQKILFYFY